MITAHRLAPALLFALAACSAPADKNPDEGTAVSDESGETAPEQVPGGVAITEVGDLIGEYRVAGVDDAELPNGEAIALSIDGPMLSFEPTCAGFVWQIGFDGDMLTTRRPGVPPVPGEAPPPVCAIAISPGQSALAQAIDAATRAERTPSNAIRLSGGGHSLTLYTQ